MRYIWMVISMMLVAAAFSACQASDLTPQVPGKGAVETEFPESVLTSEVPQDLVPTLPQEDTNMVPVTPPNEAAEKLVDLVKGHLAKKLGVGPEQIVLSDIKPVVWRDAGLGCPKPGVDYIQIETPGYNILLEASGKTYRYHTDETKRFVQCNK